MMQKLATIIHTGEEEILAASNQRKPITAPSKTTPETSTVEMHGEDL